MRSKRLSRQLKRNFGDEALDESLAGAKAAVEGLSDAGSRELLAAMIDAFPEFLSAVDEAYGQLEDKAQMAQRNLEVSSQELTGANANLFRLNQTFDAMVNSLGQGFLMFGPDGVCLPVHSKACLRLLEGDPASRPVADVLRVPPEKRETFQDWIRLLFDEVIEFDDLINVGPKMFPHSAGCVVSLEFKPVRDRDGRIGHVVVIATDRTSETRAKQEAYKMHAFATMVTSILKDKDQFRNFVAISRGIIADSIRIVGKPALDRDGLAELKRGLHTLKGAAGAFGVLQVKDLVHEVETRVSAEHDLSLVQGYLSGALQDVQRLFEGLLNEHKELFDEVLSRSEPMREIPLASLREFASKLDQGSGSPTPEEFLEEFVAVPIPQAFARYNCVLGEAAKRLGKKIEPIHFSGEDIRIVPEDYQNLLSSLVHVFRNIADHGIEAEAKRRERSKSPFGRVSISVSRTFVRGNAGMRLVIEDDGNGIDVERIRAKLREAGQGDLAREASEEQLLNRIFDAGFSTAQRVTEFSGRGVGLDAVKAEVERLGGQITVASELGRGARFTLVIPFMGRAREESKSLAG